MHDIVEFCRLLIIRKRTACQASRYDATGFIQNIPAKTIGKFRHNGRTRLVQVFCHLVQIDT